MKKSILIGIGVFSILSCVGAILASREDVEKRVIEDWKKKGFTDDDIEYLLNAFPEGKVKQNLSYYNNETNKLEDSISKD